MSSLIPWCISLTVLWSCLLQLPLPGRLSGKSRQSQKTGDKEEGEAYLCLSPTLAPGFFFLTLAFLDLRYQICKVAILDRQNLWICRVYKASSKF